MRSIVKSSFRWIGKEEAGFSLMEIIVAIGIMAAIAAITVPLVTRFTSTGESGAKTTEKQTLQTSIDTYMGSAAKATVATQAFTNNFSTGILAGAMRVATTTYCYRWGTDGKVIQSKDKQETTACGSAVDD